MGHLGVLYLSSAFAFVLAAAEILIYTDIFAYNKTSASTSARKTSALIVGSAEPKEVIFVNQTLQGVKAEIRQVCWPSRKKLRKNTVSVLLWSAALAALIFMTDSLRSAGFQLFLHLTANG
jgi:preprotein translocase SecE subunit